MSNRYYKISSLLKEKCNDNILHTKTETTPLNIEDIILIIKIKN